MAAGKLFISKKSYKTYKNTDETPEFMPSIFFFQSHPSFSQADSGPKALYCTNLYLLW